LLFYDGSDDDVIYVPRRTPTECCWLLSADCEYYAAKCVLALSFNSHGPNGTDALAAVQESIAAGVCAGGRSALPLLPFYAILGTYAEQQ